MLVCRFFSYFRNMVIFASFFFQGTIKAICFRHYSFDIQTKRKMNQQECRTPQLQSEQKQVRKQVSDKQLTALLIKNQNLCRNKPRFQTSAEPFQKFYQRWDNIQNQVHKEPMDRYIQLIIGKYNETGQPVSILDAGCGYGKQAYNMKKRLEQKGVIVEKFYGYDASAPLIEIANQKYANQPNLKYYTKNLDTDFDDVEEFDVIVSFCCLHWVNDIKGVTESISRALKPRGLFMAQIGLETRQFHELRVKFINTSRWAECFKEQQRRVSHFYFDKDIYYETFGKYFDMTYDVLTITPFHFNHKECIDFLGNWMQEVRHIITDVKEQPRKEGIVRAYISDFIDSFPLGMTKHVIKDENGNVTYTQYLLYYEGVKNC